MSSGPAGPRFGLGRGGGFSQDNSNVPAGASGMGRSSMMERLLASGAARPGESTPFSRTTAADFQIDHGAGEFMLQQAGIQWNVDGATGDAPHERGGPCAG